ncbi:response regulator transcription factor [Catenuloplanes atrovinosus]|uniref:DNA-binding response OmpR family regulator n=1 Tax=Catenuloplanes atrovinosus TaxID=137266 RepID=A0AAE4CCI8_9ACTN|nr:response regulator transcription factor [Catenuloplanes atrovinosus]MDR7279238.1 DNA-binding response OmpR family regulator [Catenuloplanes atrovinosus]
MSAHVLIAEDDRRHAEILRRYLESAGYRTTVAHDGRTALDRARRLRPDLLLLDVMMPELDGLGLCEAIRRESAVPVLMLTARTSEDDLLTGLDSGADDYLTKPYRPRELLARIRTLLRRADRAGPRDVLRAGPVAVDLTRRVVTVDDRAVECTPDEFAILAALVQQPERVFTRAQLLEQTNGYGRDSTERTIDTHVSNLRRKIEPNPRRPALLLTVYGVGYKLAGA